MNFDEPTYPITFAEATALNLMKEMEKIDRQAKEELEDLLKRFHQKICPTLKTCEGLNHKMCEGCEKKEASG